MVVLTNTNKGVTKMSFKIGDRVREIATGDEGVILEENFETCVDYVLVRWTTGLCSGMDFAIPKRDIELADFEQEPKNPDVVFITTEEYEGLRNRIAELEEALKIKEEWITWNGGACPVHPETRVDVKLAIGNIYKNEIARNLYWDSINQVGDIIAYRIVK